MREILFRGKRVDNGEWVCGYYVKSTHAYGLVVNPSYKIEHQIWYDKDNKQVYAEVDPETVGEYTGLTDKNGKRIFEGDILSERPDGNKIAYVGTAKWDDERALFRFIIKDNPKYFACLGTYSTSYKVIGTIYDNPELLEVKE